MDKEELKAYLVEEAGYDQGSVDEMSPLSLVDAWLTQQGISGYTEEILEVFDAAYEIDINSCREMYINYVK